MFLIVAVLVGLIPLVPAVYFFIRDRGNSPLKATRDMVLGLNGFNVLVGMMATAFGVFWLFSPTAAAASVSPRQRRAIRMQAWRRRSRPAWPAWEPVSRWLAPARQRWAQRPRNPSPSAAR